MFPNGQTYNGRILKNVINKEFHLDYFNSLLKFQLEQTENGGTDLTLIHENVPESDFSEVDAGWIFVLMNLKAVANSNVIRETTMPKRTLHQGYVDNEYLYLATKDHGE